MYPKPLHKNTFKDTIFYLENSNFRNIKNASTIEGVEAFTPNCTIPQLFEELITTKFEQCDAPSLIFGEKVTTFKQLDGITKIWSSKIKSKIDELMKLESSDVPEKCLTPETRHPVIAVFVPASDLRIQAILSIFRAYGIYMPLDDTLPPERIKSLLNQTGCKLVLYHSDQYRKVLEKATENLEHHVELLDVNTICDESYETITDTKPPTPNKDPILAVLFTSGSTGEPKGVPIKHSNMVNRLSYHWKTFPFGSDEKGCHRTSPLFIDHLTETLSCLLQVLNENKQ